MPLPKKFNLERFKKSISGHIEFATLIEQAEPKLRQKILDQTGSQDPDFLFLVMKRVVFFEEYVYLEAAVLAEILSDISPKVMAFALAGMEEDFRNAFLKQLGYRALRQIVEEDERVQKLTESFILGARRQILKHARALEAKGKFVLEACECPRLAKKRMRA